VNLGVFAALLVFFLLAYALGQTIAPFIVALLLAYILNPAVEALKRRGVPKAFAVVGFAVLILALAAGTLFGTVLVVKSEIHTLIDNLPSYIETFRVRYFPAVREYLDLGDMELDEVYAQVKDSLLHLSPQSYTSALGYIGAFFAGTVNIFISIAALLLIPVLMVYILMDFDKMRSSLLRVLPGTYREDIVSKLRQVEAVLRDFVKGQLVVALVLGVLYSIGLTLAGVDMPLLVGMGAGLGNLVPYLGTTLGVIVSIILVLLKYHDVMHPVLVVLVFVVVQTLEAYVVTPKIVGDKLGLHPVIVILSLLVFGKLLGFVGLIVAVPVAAVLKVFITDFVRDYMESGLHGGEGE